MDSFDIGKGVGDLLFKVKEKGFNNLKILEGKVKINLDRKLLGFFFKVEEIDMEDEFE